MEPNAALALGAVLALALPLIVLIATGLFKYGSFPFLCIYYAIMIFDNCVGENYLHASKDTSHVIAVLSNLLDPVLMLCFLTHFSRGWLTQKNIFIIIAALAGFEIYTVSLIGFDDNGLAMALGPGLATVFCMSVYFFKHQAKTSITHGRGIGKSVLLAGLIFMYGSYFISYLMYFVFKMSDITNSYIVLYFINIFSSSIMAIGIVLENFRIRKAQELIIVRKEIAELYSI